MTTLEKIKAEIIEMNSLDYVEPISCEEVLEIIDKYAEQEPTIGQLFSCEEVEELRNKIWKQVDQDPCDDAISREDALNSLIENTDFEGWELSQALKAIEDLPSVRPQEQIGHWIDTNGGVECDKCGKWYPHAPIAKNEIKFCCECGARMVKSQESEDKK